MGSKKKADMNKFKVLIGYTFLFISLILITSFISYMFNWKVDQSNVENLFDRNIEVENILGKIGASISHFLIFKSFGIASFILPLILFISSYHLLFNKKILDLVRKINWLLILMIWTTLLSGYLSNYFPIQSGIIGFEINSFLETYIGNIGIILVLSFMLVLSLAVLFNFTPNSILLFLKKNIIPKKSNELLKNNEIKADNKLESNTNDLEVIDQIKKDEIKLDSVKSDVENYNNNISMEVEEINFEEKSTGDIGFSKVNPKKFDPTLDLSSFKNPSIELLKDYGDGTIKIDQEELETNKNKIVDTLKNYNIGIKQIKATIGPTVTLYEIIPEAGIRISKIRIDKQVVVTITMYLV